MTKPMTFEEVERYHAACKIIELDGCEGYFSCRDRFGADIAGAALVMWLRCRFYRENEYDKLKAEVNNVLEKSGRLHESQTESQYKLVTRILNHLVEHRSDPEKLNELLDYAASIGIGKEG